MKQADIFLFLFFLLLFVKQTYFVTHKELRLVKHKDTYDINDITLRELSNKHLLGKKAQMIQRKVDPSSQYHHNVRHLI